MNGFDELAAMSDDQLNRLFMKTRGDISRYRKRSAPTTDLEIDLCYIQRELFIRASRQKAHGEYVQSQPSRQRRAY